MKKLNTVLKLSISLFIVVIMLLPTLVFADNNDAVNKGDENIKNIKAYSEENEKAVNVLNILVKEYKSHIKWMSEEVGIFNGILEDLYY